MRALYLLVLVGCQLGDPPEPPKCDAGTHPDKGQCVQDRIAELVIKIENCTVTPDVLIVKPGDAFQFENDDATTHEIHGSDGKLWASVPAKQRSAFTEIDKVGTWPYSIVGCAKGGSVQVE